MRECAEGMGHESASELQSKNRFFNFISGFEPLAEMSNEQTEEASYGLELTVRKLL